MTRSELAKDTLRASKELRRLLRINEEWDIQVTVGEITEPSVTLLPGDTAAGYVQADLTNLMAQIVLCRESMTHGEKLWGTLAHELLHLYQAELIQSVNRLDQARPHLRPLAVELVQASEIANVRTERLFLRAYPCPAWLKSKTYGDAP